MATLNNTSNSRATALREALWLTLVAILGELSLAAIGAILGLLVFLVIADGVAEGATRAFDEQLSTYFVTHQPAWLHEPLMAITFLANGPALVTVTVICCLFLVAARRLWPDIGIALLTAAGGFGLVELIKATYERPRPPGAFAHGYSFPSGHAFLSLTIYGALVFLLSANWPKKLRRLIWGVAVALAILIGSSRVLLGVHYPSDVLAGFMGGAFWLWGCMSLRRLAAKRDWGAWKESRINRLRAAKDLLREAKHDRPKLEEWLLIAERSKPTDLKSSLAYWFFKTLYKLLKRVGAVHGKGYDLLLLAQALRFANLAQIPEDTEATRRRLHVAQRGLFGYAMD
jgi:membrane-associated phospholipid phosphatase